MGYLRPAVSFLFSVVLLIQNNVAEGSYSRYTGTSRLQPSYSIVACNSSESQAGNPMSSTLGTVPTSIQTGSDYLTPTILNYSPNGQSSENENDIDIGTRINIPMASPVTTGTVWMPHRLALPNRLASTQYALSKEDQLNLLDVENGVKFFLFTRENPIKAQELHVNLKKTVEGSNFVASRPTKLILHGFTDVDAPGEWVNALKEAYLTASDVNVIVVDYSSFSMFLLFRTNLPIFASKRLGEMVVFLEVDGGASRESFHIIARAWACHVAGMAGRLLGGKVGRITGIEPADKIAINGAPEYKLQREDAQFVDVRAIPTLNFAILIHINGKRFFFHGAQFGLQGPSGHVDIYPSIAERGLGCPGENQSLRRYSLRFCQLGRGVRYFTNSIKYQQLYPMCPCQSFEHYKAGLCKCSQSDAVAFMGESLSNQTRGVFQLAAAPTQNQVLTNFRYYSPVFG